MKRFFLMPFVLILRGVRLLKHPSPFVFSCEGHNYAIPHHGRSLNEVKMWFFNYYKNALVCSGCNRILLPGEKVSTCGNNGIAHYDEHCVRKPDYLGVIGKDGRVIPAYPQGLSMEEMARRAIVRKTHDL